VRSFPVGYSFPSVYVTVENYPDAVDPSATVKTQVEVSADLRSLLQVTHFRRTRSALAFSMRSKATLSILVTIRVGGRPVKRRTFTVHGGPGGTFGKPVAPVIALTGYHGRSGSVAFSVAGGLSGQPLPAPVYYRVWL
jgi:hypothetical protein